VIVLDAYAVLALLKDEPAAVPVRRLLESREETCLTVLGVAEVIDHLVRLAGVHEEEAVLDLAQLGLSEAVAVDAVLAMQAGLLRARHYHRRTRCVSLVDCHVAAAARSLSASVASADPHLLDLCRDERIDVAALPDTRGMMWQP
jgi:PIN domain nuclease of toxin-antitoxin system